MTLTYEQFINIVPNETREFVDIALPYLDYYLKDGRSIKVRRTDLESVNYYSKTLMLLFYCLDLHGDNSAFLKKAGFDASRLRVENEYDSLKSKEEMFENVGAVFTIYDDKSLYYGLKPLELIKHALKLYREKANVALFTYLFPRMQIETFSIELDSLIRKEKEQLEQQIEKERYGQLPIPVITYIETATKIRELLYKILKNRKYEIVNRIEEDIVPLSLLLSLYFSSNTSDKNADFSQTCLIQDYLKEKGVTLEGIFKTLGFNMTSSNISSYKKNVFCLKDSYERYYKEGVNKEKELCEVDISSVITNLFNRSFSGSLIIEKLLAKQNCFLDQVNSLEKEINSIKEKKQQQQSIEYVKAFYLELSKETKDFINFTAKAYYLILEKMKQKVHNTKYLFNEDDADTLALYISTAMYNGEVNEFFKDHGVTLEKVLKLLNLNVTQEEIQKTQLDQKLLVDRFKRYVYEGINTGKRRQNIKVADISKNLCNQDFNRSMILENVFEDIADKELEKDFTKQLKQHLEIKEQTRKRKLYQEFFHDISVDTIEYLEAVSQIHNLLKSQNNSYSHETIKSFALLLGIFFSTNKDLKEFFESRQITYNKVSELLKVNIYKLDPNNADIDLLIDEYENYIFGGVNHNIERKDLSILNISKNIFNKSLNSSVEIVKFLSNFGLTYEFFTEFDKNYQEYLNDVKEKKLQMEASSLLNACTGPISNYLRNVVKIHKRLLASFKKEDNVIPLNNVHDLIELSMVLGLFTIDNNARYFFEKNELTLANILSTLNLDEDILLNLASDSFDYHLFLENYKVFTILENNNKVISSVIKKIFSSNFSKNSLVLENLCAKLGSDYNILKEEVETQKDYELSLTIDERIKLLSDSTVDKLNMDDIKSILHFGNGLSMHSKYIHDEIPRLVMENSHDKSIETINQIVGRVYTKEKQSMQKRGLFKGLFSLKKENNQTKVIINQDVVCELKESIDKNIIILSRELIGYDAIRKYIEVYRQKNYSHLLISAQETKNIEEKLKTMDSSNEKEYANFLQATSHLQIMKDKTNRFFTSNHLMKQELFKINQAIVNHFITINALEMARDDLMPLIGSELALTRGRESENSAIDLSQSMVNLFKSLLSRNVEGALENMVKLKEMNLPESIYQTLNQDIEIYLKKISSAPALSKETLSLENGEENYFKTLKK